MAGPSGLCVANFVFFNGQLQKMSIIFGPVQISLLSILLINCCFLHLFIMFLLLLSGEYRSIYLHYLVVDFLMEEVRPTMAVFEA